MSAIYNNYLSDDLRAFEIDYATSMSELNKLNTMLEMVDMKLETQLADADLKVLTESGTSDDLEYLYEEANAEAGTQSKGIIQSIIDKVIEIYHKIADFISEKILKRPAKGNVTVDQADIDNSNEITSRFNAVKDGLNEIANGAKEHKFLAAGGAIAAGGALAALVAFKLKQPTGQTKTMSAEEAKGLGQKVHDNVVKPIGDLLDRLKNKAGDIGKAVIDALQTFGGKIKGFVSSIAAKFGGNKGEEAPAEDGEATTDGAKPEDGKAGEKPAADGAQATTNTQANKSAVDPKKVYKEGLPAGVRDLNDKKVQSLMAQKKLTKAEYDYYVKNKSSRDAYAQGLAKKADSAQEKFDKDKSNKYNAAKKKFDEAKKSGNQVEIDKAQKELDRINALTLDTKGLQEKYNSSYSKNRQPAGEEKSSTKQAMEAITTSNQALANAIEHTTDKTLKAKIKPVQAQLTNAESQLKTLQKKSDADPKEIERLKAEVNRCKSLYNGFLKRSTDNKVKEALAGRNNAHLTADAEKKSLADKAKNAPAKIEADKEAKRKAKEEADKAQADAIKKSEEEDQAAGNKELQGYITKFNPKKLLDSIAHGKTDSKVIDPKAKSKFTPGKDRHNIYINIGDKEYGGIHADKRNMWRKLVLTNAGGIDDDIREWKVSGSPVVYKTGEKPTFESEENEVINEVALTFEESADLLMSDESLLAATAMLLAEQAEDTEYFISVENGEDFLYTESEEEYEPDPSIYEESESVSKFLGYDPALELSVYEEEVLNNEIDSLLDQFENM